MGGGSEEEVSERRGKESSEMGREGGETKKRKQEVGEERQGISIMQDFNEFRALKYKKRMTVTSVLPG